MLRILAAFGQLRPSAVAAEISRERSFAPTLLRRSRPQLTPARGGYRLRAGRPISPSARPRQPAIRCLSRHLVGLDFLSVQDSGSAPKSTR
jgi:hypothetical protein